MSARRWHLTISHVLATSWDVVAGAALQARQQSPLGPKVDGVREGALQKQSVKLDLADALATAQDGSMSLQELAYWEYIVSLIAVFALKIACFILAYLTVRLGHSLISAGVKGEFRFSARFAGAKADLVSVSPGLLFVLLGVALAVFAIRVEKPVRQEIVMKPAAGLSDDANSLAVPSRSEKPEFRNKEVKP